MIEYAKRLALALALPSIIPDVLALTNPKELGGWDHEDDEKPPEKPAKCRSFDSADSLGF